MTVDCKKLCDENFWHLSWKHLMHSREILHDARSNTTFEVITTDCIFDGMSIRNQRRTNMDSLLLKHGTLDGRSLYLAAVSDGVGSTENGGVAAAITIRAMDDWITTVDSGMGLGVSLCDCVLRANRLILSEINQEHGRGASTLSVLLLYEDRYYVAHVGDSRIYLLRGGELRKLTVDQSIDGKLTSYLGNPRMPEVVYREGETVRGDVFLLCSDGLYKRMEPQFLLESLMAVNRRNLKKVMEKLIRHVVDHGENDNISLALIIHES